MTTQQALQFLRGMPVWVCRRGTYPSSDDVRQIQANYPGARVRTEHITHPCHRFVVTVERKR